MKSGIPRPGGIPRLQPTGTRIPVVQAPRRVLAPPRIATKVRSAPVIPVAPARIIARGPPPQAISKPNLVVKKLQPLTRPSFGFSRQVPLAAPRVASPVITMPASLSIPTSPVRVGNTVVMVPDEVVQVTPQRSPVRAVALPVVQEPIMEPVVLHRTPVIFPRRRFRYTDPKNELFNQRPTPIYNESVLLQSPSGGRPKILDVAVNPRPIVTTESGDHVVCDISLNVRDPPMSLVPNRVPRPVGFHRERRRRARKAPEAVIGEDMIPVTPSIARDYPNTPLSVLTRRRFARRILEEGPTGPGFYKLLNTKKIRFPVRENLDTSIEWEPKDVCNDLNYINLLSPFKETNLMTFSPTEVPIRAYDDIDLIQFS